MRPLDLHDLAALQADLDVLDERDLIAELSPGRVVPPRPVPVAPRPVPVAPLPGPGRAIGVPPAPAPVPPTRGGPATHPPARPLPPVPAPVDRPVRRTGPLPEVAPTRGMDVRLARPRHAAAELPGAGAPSGRGLLGWALGELPG